MMFLYLKLYHGKIKRVMLFVLIAITMVVPYILYNYEPIDEEVIDYEVIKDYVEGRLEEYLKQVKGTGCEVPQLNPFDEEAKKMDEEFDDIFCDETVWVKCYLSQCRITDSALLSTRNTMCTFQDILYIDENEYKLGPKKHIYGRGVYTLVESDHVKVSCHGISVSDFYPKHWSGCAVGFREKIAPPEQINTEDANSTNVLIICFDSTSKSNFVRHMPLSYRTLKYEMEAIVMDGYNIVGDGTTAAIIPILSGLAEFDVPNEMRKENPVRMTLDAFPFIFRKLTKHGYRTAYFEDSPSIGTFQNRYNGFAIQPTDHFLYYLFTEYEKQMSWKIDSQGHCFGDEPQYKMMLNLTEQFFKLDRKKFCFTFISDITHEVNMISVADSALRDTLRRLKWGGVMENTLVIVMGDHGPRYAKFRNTYRGKLEERLPFLAVILPNTLKRKRRNLKRVLKKNSRVLTTPYDLHATLVDAMDMKGYTVNYRVPGSDLNRAMSLLDPIPSTRSCPEAGIEAHWCSCAHWDNVTDANVTSAAVGSVLRHINMLTQRHRSLCARRNITSIEYVKRFHLNPELLKFSPTKHKDGILGRFNATTVDTRQRYNVKFTSGPGDAIFEATLVHDLNKNKFEVSSQEITRTNAYGDQPKCIRDKYPRLNLFCFCL